MRLPLFAVIATWDKVEVDELDVEFHGVAGDPGHGSEGSVRPAHQAVGERRAA